MRLTTNWREKEKGGFRWENVVKTLLGTVCSGSQKTMKNEENEVGMATRQALAR